MPTLCSEDGSDSPSGAVPEDCARPAFVTAPAREFSGRPEERGVRPFGFETGAAGARRDGFGLFPCLGPEPLPRPTTKARPEPGFSRSRPGAGRRRQKPASATLAVSVTLEERLS